MFTQEIRCQPVGGFVYKITKKAATTCSKCGKTGHNVRTCSRWF